MMATTHGFVGLTLASVVASQTPEFAVPAAVGGILGGVFPDLDVAAEHRRTLHFPAYYVVVAVPSVVVAVLVTEAITVAVATFLVAAAVHSLSDVFGGTPDADPWNATTEHAVYLHARGTWLRARQWIRYDGAPEDFAVGALFAVPALVTFDGPLRALVIAGLFVSLVYTVFRRRIGRTVARWS